MKKRLILFYLFFCITFPLQAGIRDKIVRVITSKPADILPQATGLAGSTSLNAVTNSAANAALTSTAATATQGVGTLPPALVLPQDLSALQMYKFLKSQVTQTYQEAIRLQEDLPNPGIMGEPVKFHSVSLYPMKGKEIYPDQPLLHKGLLTPVLTHLYYLAESNRIYIQHLRESQSFWPAFNDAIPRFYQEAESMVQPKEDELVEWAAAQIPADTQILGIGEIHGYRELPTFLADLLEKIDAQMTEQDRKVILFTEFLSNPDTPGHLLGGLVNCPYGHYYTAVWNRARHLDIEVVGLEDRYVKKDLSTVTAYAGDDSTYTMQQWATMSGIRIRNRHWSETLQKYREENPDALFVIYAGSGHLLYNYPLSLLSYLSQKEEKTFMLNLIPDEVYEDGQLFYDTDPLEELNSNLTFPQPAIRWQSPDLVQLSGYDARVRLPIDIKAKREDLVHWGLDDYSHQLPGWPR